jgi:glycosyltransferase involved in cell wall biosynthesis
MTQRAASNPNASAKKRIVFAIDRVMHYHKATIAALERELDTRGYEFFLLSSQDKPGAKGRVAFHGKVTRNHDHFRLTEKMVGTFAVRYQHGLVPAIEKIRPDIVISLCHSGTVSEWRLLSLKKQLGFRLIAWQCGYEFNPGRLKKFILGRFVPRFDHHLAYHTNAKHYAIAHGARPDQVTVMHNTINEAAIACMRKDEARELVSERWPAIAGKKIVLYVGAVLEEKRLEVVFDALDILKREDVVFLLVGDGPHLKEIKRKYGDRKDCVFTGQIVEGVGLYFDAAEMYLLPGTGGLGINEAMAHSLPIISGYADGSADDLVVDGQNGYRLREGSPEELADRITRVLDQPVVAADMGRTSREWITGKFAFSAFVDRIVTTLVAQTQR